MSGTLLLLTGPAFAGDCTNASKDLHAPLNGAQILFNSDGSVTLGTGVQRRLSKGLINFDTFEGIHGPVSFTEGSVTLTTYIVGPSGFELPSQAQSGGTPCHGITSIDTYLAC